LATEAGLCTASNGFVDWVDAGPCLHEMTEFAKLIAAKERQRLHDKFMQIHKSQKHSNNYWHFAARKISEES
jgi:hypothetical protein